VTSAPTGYQVKALLWREINNIHKLGGLPGRTNTTEWLFGNELVGFGRSVRDADPTAFQGIHAPFVLVILDEACGITSAIWTAAETLVANDDSRFLAIGNPDDPATEFGNSCRPGTGYNVIQISAYESPNFTDEECPDWLKQQLVGEQWVEERAKRWGEESPRYLSKVMGDFPEQSTDGLIPITAVREAVARELEAVGPVELGVDVARFGLDKTVIYKRQGPVARIYKRMTKRDTMWVTGEVVKAIKDTDATLVKIDDIGLGGGVVDRLRELRFEGEFDAEIAAINVGEQPITSAADEVFYNKRIELNWMMRDRFVEGDIDIEDDDDLQVQIVNMKYKHTSRGKLILQSKADMKKDTKLPSPDEWDALVLAFTPREYGVDMAFMEQAETFTYDPFSIPEFWPRVYAIDINGNEMSVVWGSWDTESETVYLYDEFISTRPDISINASSIRKRKAWVPGLFYMRDHGRSEEQGQGMINALLDEGLDIFEKEEDMEIAVNEMVARLTNQTLKVSKRMERWMDQYHKYKRDKKGELVQERDGLLRASGLIVQGGQFVATTADILNAKPDEVASDDTKNPSTGY